MELLFIRHGETEYNKRKQLMGQRIDAPLDETGLAQAKTLIPKIPADFSLIYASPLKRAAQTAQVIAEHYGKQIKYNDNLIERNFGSLSGKTWEQMTQETGLPILEIDRSLQYDYTPYGGENVDQVKNRLISFLREVKDMHSQEKVVVVTHAGIIRLMQSLYPNMDKGAVENGTIHKFEI